LFMSQESYRASNRQSLAVDRQNLCNLGATQRRAIMIEVGMQNSGLGAALAATYFNPAASLPSAIFSVWHNFSGALVANFFVRKDKA